MSNGKVKELKQEDDDLCVNVFNNAPMAMLIVDSKVKIVKINKEAKKILKLSLLRHTLYVILNTILYTPAKCFGFRNINT